MGHNEPPRSPVATASTPAAMALGLFRFVWSHPGNRGGRLRACGRVVGWQVWQRAVRKPWTTHLPGGLALECRPHWTAASGVIYCRLPEWWEMRFVLDYLRPGDCFIDVGANVGVYSLLAASVPEVRVWAFEPSSETVLEALANVARNRLGDRVRIVRSAVGDKAGAGAVSTGLDSVNRLVESGDGRVATEPVDIVTLDDAVPAGAWATVAVVKIDVEGGEPAVLEGAVRLLAEAKPVVLVERNRPAELEALLAPRGYAAHAYDPDRRALVPVSWRTNTNANVLYALPAHGERLAATRGS